MSVDDGAIASELQVLRGYLEEDLHAHNEAEEDSEEMPADPVRAAVVLAKLDEIIELQKLADASAETS